MKLGESNAAGVILSAEPIAALQRAERCQPGSGSAQGAAAFVNFTLSENPNPGCTNLGTDPSQCHCAKAGLFFPGTHPIQPRLGHSESSRRWFRRELSVCFQGFFSRPLLEPPHKQAQEHGFSSFVSVCWLTGLCRAGFCPRPYSSLVFRLNPIVCFCNLSNFDLATQDHTVSFLLDHTRTPKVSHTLQGDVHRALCMR